MSTSGGGVTPATTPPPIFLEDSVVEILTWLPVKSVTRFKSLARRFRSLTTHPKFVETHLRRSSAALLILPKTVPPANKDFPTSLFDLESRSIRDLVHVPDFKAIAGLNHHGHGGAGRGDYVYLLGGSCGGLVYIKLAVCCFPPVHVLWNPDTRQFRTDVRDQLYEFVPAEMTCWFRDTSTGLGYDAAAGDYKLVALNHVYYDPGSRLNNQEIVDGKSGSQFRIQPVVFSLNDNSAREVVYCGARQCHAPPNWMCRSGAGVHVKGALYWEVDKTPGSDDTHYLLRFDLATEGFGKVRLPEPCKGKEYGVEGYRDKAAVFVHSEGEFKLWSLLDEGWRKVYSIVGEMPRMGFRILAVGIEEEEEAAAAAKVLIQERWWGQYGLVDGGVWMYDPVVNQMINLVSADNPMGEQDDSTACRFGVITSKHVESLVSVYGE